LRRSETCLRWVNCENFVRYPGVGVERAVTVAREEVEAELKREPLLRGLVHARHGAYEYGFAYMEVTVARANKVKKGDTQQRRNK